MNLKRAYEIVIGMAEQVCVSEAYTYGEPEAMPAVRAKHQEALKVLGEFMASHLAPKRKKPEPFFLTPSMEAVLNVLLMEPRTSRTKVEISELCNPPTSDHAVSARVSDLRKRGFDIQKARVKGSAHYRYFIPRS